MTPTEQRKKLFRIAATALLLISLVVLILFILSEHNQNKPGYDKRYKDPYSGETISDITAKSPEKAVASGNKPIFLGFKTLIEHGFSQEQLIGAQVDIQSFLDETKRSAKYVSFDVKSYVRNGTPEENNGVSKVSFTIVVNFEDKYKVDLESAGISDVTLHIFDADHKNKLGSYLYDPSAYEQDATSE